MPHTVRRTCAEQVFHDQSALSNLFRWRNWKPTMEATSRLFLCAGCRTQVHICSRCDRGQPYCANGCSQAARHQSLRAAGHRYQQSRRGRLKHAERARRYRRRQHKVTHQGSGPTNQHGLLPANSTEVEPVVLNRNPAFSGLVQCHFCGGSCAVFVRYNFLGRSRAPNIVQVDRRGTKHDYSH
jgi:hypothetical protein